MLRNVLIVANPNSGTKKGKTILEEVHSILTERNYKIDTLLTEYRKHAQQFLTTCKISHYEFLIVIGGDGTIHEVINGMLNRKDDIIIPIGVLGGGTGNALLTELERDKLSVRQRVEEMLKEKEQLKMDVGLVTYKNNSGLDEQTYFFNLIGLGLAVDANKTAERLRKRCSFLGQMRYVCGVICNLFRNKAYEIEIMRDNDEAYYSYFTNCVFIQNTVHGGDRLTIAPKAKIDDGYFDLVFNIQKTRREMYHTLRKVETDGSHIEDEKVKYYQFQNLKLKAPEPMDLNIDGENYGTTELEVGVHSKQIELM